jgi:hypothetical protein
MVPETYFCAVDPSETTLPAGAGKFAWDADEATYFYYDVGEDFADQCVYPYVPPNSDGDPITTFEGIMTRYWLPTDRLTTIFQQPPFVIRQRAGPTRKKVRLIRRGDWGVEVKFEVRSAGRVEALSVEVASFEGLLPSADDARPVPAVGEPLTTMILTTGDGQRLAHGKHTMGVNNTVAVSTEVLATKRIGNGFVERVDIVASDLHLRIESAKANKLSSLEEQVAALHLDVKFLKFDRKAAAGALPEMWGLRLMSEETKQLLVKPDDKEGATDAQGSVVAA